MKLNSKPLYQKQAVVVCPAVQSRASLSFQKVRVISATPTALTHMSNASPALVSSEWEGARLSHACCQHPGPGLHYIIPALFPEYSLSFSWPSGSSSPAHHSPWAAARVVFSLPCSQPSMTPNNGNLTAWLSALLTSPTIFPGLTPSVGGERL